jgi:hypothetical protein
VKPSDEVPEEQKAVGELGTRVSGSDQALIRSRAVRMDCAHEISPAHYLERQELMDPFSFLRGDSGRNVL